MTRDREQESGSREREAEIPPAETERMSRLIKSALPRIVDEPEMERDLWPAMLQRMDHESAVNAVRVPWFDWALAGGLVAFAAIAPRTIPVILYYL